LRRRAAPVSTRARHETGIARRMPINNDVEKRDNDVEKRDAC